MDVHLVHHIRHARNLDGSPIEHRDSDGELNFDDGYDDFKIIGIYSSPEAAQGGINRARKLAGFQDEPDCFNIDRFTVDEDNWTDGFMTLQDEDDG